MDITKEVMSAVNQAVLGEAISDPELNHMASILSQIADILKADPASAETGFLTELMDLNADLLSQSEKTKVINKQTETLKELDEAKAKLRKLISQAKSHYTKEEVNRLKTKLDSLIKKYTALAETDKSLRKKLHEIGYSESISESRFKEKKLQAALLEQEVSDLREEVKQYEGLEASDESFRAKIAEMRIKIENFSSLDDI
jgi:chromosome segregation ATPase